MQIIKPELPGYELLEMLGEDGAMTIWKARQVSLDRFVTIKVLAVNATTHAQSLTQLRHEATAAAKLKNPGIIQIFDAGEFGPFAYIVLEFIEGRTVQKQLNLVSVMSEDEALAIVQWVALALQYAWKEHRVIHCDIKPSNIVLSESGDVRVGNLGVAQVLNAMSAGGSVDDFVGTPHYASPEYVGGKTTLDCRTDIYSLGATFYHLVTGVLPFGTLEPSEILEQQLLGHLEDPRDLNPNVSDAATAVIHKMMAKTLTDRYADWKELLKDLHALKKRSPLPCSRCASGHSTVRLSHPLILPPPLPPEQQRPVEPATPAEKMKIRVNKRDLAAKPPSVIIGLFRLSFAASLLALLGGGIYAAARFTPLGNVLRGYLDNALDYADYYLYGRVPAGRTISSPGQTLEAPQPQRDLEPLALPELEYVSPAPVEQPTAPAQAADWKSDPHYQQGLQLYREARQLYSSYISSRQNPSLLGEAEAKCREAIELFKLCRKTPSATGGHSANH